MHSKVFFNRLLSKLHSLAKIALFGIFFGKFFEHMPSYALKIFQKTCSKIANFFKQSKFRKKSNFFLLFLLTSCIKPNYTPQYVDIPNTWRLKGDEGSTLCNFRWWEQFQDPVLNRLIDIALENNLDLQVAISRVLEYYGRLGVTNSYLYPEVDLQANYNRTEVSLLEPTLTAIEVQNRIFNTFQGFFNLNWELDFSGRLSSASEAAYADLMAQVEARRVVVITVVTSVANAYILLRQLDGQLDISKKTLMSRVESLELAKSRFLLGETSEMEVKQAESEVKDAAIRVIQFERDIPQQENHLSILLGENPRAIERGSVLATWGYPFEIPAGLPSDLLTQRPDIAEAEQKLIAANAHVAEARALFFPQINLTGFFGNESDQLKTLLTSPAQMWQYGFNLLEPIFNAGRTSYQVDATKAQRDEALFNYRQTILTAFQEVEDALIGTQKNQELVIEHQEQVQVLSEYLHLAQLRYLEGEIDYLNVLDAERSLFEAQLAMIAAQADNFHVVVQLYGALGGGWVIDADPVKAERPCSE
jgi:multidrug efflux system outer membrane protein